MRLRLSRNDKQGEVPPLPCSAKGVITFSHSFCGQHFLLLMSFRLSDRRERMEKSRLIQPAFSDGVSFRAVHKKEPLWFVFFGGKKNEYERARGERHDYHRRNRGVALALGFFLGRLFCGQLI